MFRYHRRDRVGSGIIHFKDSHVIRDSVITVADRVTALVATRKSHDEVAAGDLTRALTATWGDSERFLRRGAPGGVRGAAPS